MSDPLPLGFGRPESALFRSSVVPQYCFGKPQATAEPNLELADDPAIVLGIQSRTANLWTTGNPNENVQLRTRIVGLDDYAGN